MSARSLPSSFIPSGGSPGTPPIPPMPPTAPPPTRHFLAEYATLWRIPAIRWLALGNGLSNMIFFSTVIVRFEQSRGLDFTEIFLLESLVSVFAWLFDIPTGVWADQFGRKRLLLAGRALNALSLVVTALAQGFWPFAFGSLFFGAGLACVSGCESALVHESLPESLPDDVSQTRPSGAAAFALLGTAQSGGFFVGLIAGSALGAVDPTISVVASLIPAALAILATGWLPADAPNHQKDTDGRTPSAPTPAPLTPTPSPASARKLLHGAWMTVLTQPRLVVLSLTQSGAFALVNAIFWYNQPFFARAKLPIVWYGSLTALAVGCGMLAPLALPWARRRLGARGALAVALLAP
ncbi:MAG: MFS transporter, partial [Ktedonobacterales bacterium]